jgi:hypothetical protein
MTRYYWGRLVVGLVAVALSLACSAILDTDTLNTAEPDGSAKDADTEKDQKVEKDLLPGDLGSCKPGVKCTVVGKKGLCAVGTAICYEAGTGTCKQTVAPTTEQCDGRDTDCDGTADNSDSNAHAACKTKHPNRANRCAGSTCACGAGDVCAPGHNCAAGDPATCKCGANAKCTQLNPTCSSGKCVCDANSTCKANERCDGGACHCGKSVGESSGPFCTQGTCNSTTGKCEGIPPDAGPDGPVPDTTPWPDGAPPDTTPWPDSAAPDTTPWPDTAVEDQGGSDSDL